MASLLRRKKKYNQYKRPSTIKSDLVKIYRDKDGKIPDISRLEVKKRNWIKTIFILFTVSIVILAGLAWLGFFIFGNGDDYRGQSLDIKITADKKIASGDEVVYKIEIKNKEKETLNNIELFIRFPEGFDYLSASPEPDNKYNNRWQLGQLLRGETKEVEIVGKLIGQVGTIKTVDLKVAFEPTSFSATFNETASLSQQITSSILEIEVEGPVETLPEKKIEYIVKYKNSSDKTLENVKLQIIYPLNFVYQSAEPEPYQGEEDEIARKLNNIWQFESVESEFEGSVLIKGGYVADDEEEKNFIVQIGFLDEDGNFQLQQEQKVTTKIIQQHLNLELFINGENNNNPVNFGETLNYLITYNNFGQSVLEDVEIEIIIESELVDWETVNGKELGEVDEDEKTIRWTSEHIEQLARIDSVGDDKTTDGQIEFSLKLKEFETVDIEDTNFETKSIVNAYVGRVDDLEAEIVVNSNALLNIINTELQLKAEGRYFNEDNIAVGNGPLPPVVGQKTSYRIYWYIANSLNDVTDVEVTATLPQGVDFTGKFLVNAGELTYLNDEKIVKWNISKISPNKTFDDVNIWFDVEVIPINDQKGKIIVLATQTELKAIDVKTEDEITKIKAAITSNLEHDPNAKGKGIVIGFE